ncbi:hypothetical protein HYU06_05660 [Candidatus Woesearchaeota archaeon]|nr:hypothetical protein [Candidatus Woesearchaeota archaeon]
MKITINVMKRHLYILILLVAVFLLLTFAIAYNSAGTGGTPAVMGHSADELDWSKPITMQDKLVVNKELEVAGNVKFNLDLNVEGDIKSKNVGRKSYYAPKSSRGTTIKIPELEIIDLCGDDDGCEVRMIMYDWDGNLRSASRTFNFFYNKDNKKWRTELNDIEGTNGADGTQHIAGPIWSCYFTDGKFDNWVDQGDTDLDFGLLSWNQADAECRLFVID